MLDVMKSSHYVVFEWPWYNQENVTCGTDALQFAFSVQGSFKVPNSPEAGKKKEKKIYQNHVTLAMHDCQELYMKVLCEK